MKQNPAGLTILAFVFLGFLPLLPYLLIAPWLLVGLGGHRSADTSFFMVLFVYAFALGLLAYPCVYFACVITAFREEKKNDTKKAICFAIFPVGYLLLFLAMGALLGVN
jgi:4-hydroxybenzoate polyprenyltransferase